MEKVKLAIDLCELKFAKGDNGQFEGYASVFNSVDSGGDTITPGAFSETLKNDPAPKMFVNHDSWTIPVGDWVKLEEDSKGLFAVGQIDLNHNDGPSLYSAMKRKAMDGLSIGFKIPPNGAVWTDPNYEFRTINAIQLKEISVVNFPMETQARVTGVKAEIETIESIREAEAFLRDAGTFSKSAAIAFLSRVRALVRSDYEKEQQDELERLNSRLNSKNVTSSLVQFIDNLGDKK